MRIAAHRGTRLHAPENTLTALLSGYTAGAGALEFDLQLTQDGHLVLSHDETVERLTGQTGNIAALDLEQLRDFDFSEAFQPRHSGNFRYHHLPRHRVPVLTFAEALDWLPRDVPKLIELKPQTIADSGRRETAVAQLIDVLQQHDALEQAVVYSMEPEAIRLIRQHCPDVRACAFDYRLSAAQQLQLMRDLNADGLVLKVADVLGDNGRLTETGDQLKQGFASGLLRVGAVLYPYRGSGRPWVIEDTEFEALQDEEFVWSCATDSLIDNAAYARAGWNWLAEDFAGPDENRQRFAFGYAKANRFCHVFQDDGVHIQIAPYDGPSPRRPQSDLEQRILRLENEMMYAQRDWPFYSGGGFGLTAPIAGDFAAEVDYAVLSPMTQAVTLEMAAVNVDPGAHQRPWNSDGTPRVPTSFRNKDSFYDPHGCPPYVGVEHDEDDGYRINWNLGNESDNNQYGRPVGDGKTPQAGRLRLERRGSYFSAYYRNEVDALDWVCVGAVRNESLNEVVFLRCVAKRWRQEKSEDPSQYWPIVPNTFTFRNLTITRYPAG